MIVPAEIDPKAMSFEELVEALMALDDWSRAGAEYVARSLRGELLPHETQPV